MSVGSSQGGLPRKISIAPVGLNKGQHNTSLQGTHKSYAEVLKLNPQPFAGKSKAGELDFEKSKDPSLLLVDALSEDLEQVEKTKEE